MVEVVDIYLDSDDSDPQLLLLSVPSSDIQRLTNSPLKWLRFVTFTICGARGHLLASHNGHVVDYGTSINDIVGEYYYHPSEPYEFVDYNVLHDRITSSALTPRRHDFRYEVIRRDGACCVITQQPAMGCQASHIIPRSKGHEYIRALTQRRRSRYNPIPPVIGDINAAENGILLNFQLHVYVGLGVNAFLKTPNFAMDPEDVPRVEDGPMPSNRVTLQYLKTIAGSSLPQAVDAVFPQPRDGNDAPPSILLDFVYGAAAYELWGNGSQSERVLHDKFMEEYQNIPVLPEPDLMDEDCDSEPEPDDPTDGDHDPGFASRRKRAHRLEDPTDDLQNDRFYSDSCSKPLYPNYVPRPSLSNAMDNMNLRMMRVCGVTPEMRMAEWQKEVEEKQMKDEEMSRSKVNEWMKNSQRAA